jgi:hypothetical protein
MAENNNLELFILEDNMAASAKHFNETCSP